MRSTFEERVFQKNRPSEQWAFFLIFGGCFLVFPKIFLYVCNNFDLEPRRKMLLGC